MKVFKQTFSGLILTLALSAPLLGQDKPANPVVLAPGYGELDFVAPEAGTYDLPPLGSAPDGPVLKDDGSPSSLYKIFGDNIVLLSFIYSSCNDVNGCPLATAVLNRMRQRFSKEPDIADDIKLVSLSFDPEHDSPEVMRLYGANFKGEGVEWEFITTLSEEQLAPILKAYNQSIVKDYDETGNYVGTISHILRVLLIDRQHKIRNIYNVSFLHPDILTNDVKSLLMEEKNGAVPLASADIVEQIFRAGDHKEGYESADYRTQSVSLTDRPALSADLLSLAQNPPLGLPPVPVPEDNPLTTEKIQLGRKLFFDRRLSLNDTISCAICHVPEQGFANNELETAVGIEGSTVRRNAPTMYNVGYLQRLFHDGREHTLENQVWQPLTASNEMANPSVGMVIEKLKKMPDYKGLFEEAFGGAPPNILNVGQALASYQRTLVSGDSAFDRWHYGKDPSALNPEAQRGFALFTGKAGCSACHTIGETSAIFTDNTMHNTGVGYYESMLAEPNKRKVQLAPGVFVDVRSDLISEVAEGRPNDLGQYEVTQNPSDRWKYRTPGLRNVSLTAPYMHNGSIATLRDVVEYYNRGGVPNEILDPLIRPLNLTESEIDEIVAFLKSLKGSNTSDLVLDAFAAPIGDPRSVDPNWAHDNRIEY